jgi:hypothetical protein
MIPLLYCGKKPGLEKEHVVPRQFFIKPLPSNLITVPSCTNCNRSFGKIEEYLRTSLLLNTNCDSQACRDLREKKSPYKTLQRSAGLLNTLRKSMRVIPETTRSGIIIGSQTVVPLDNKRLNAFVKKIVFGLHFHRTKQRLSDKVIIGFQFVTPRNGISFGNLLQLQNPRWPNIFDWAVNDTYGEENTLFAFSLWDMYVCLGYYGLKLPIQVGHPWHR